MPACAVDTTAAGDAFNATLAFKLGQGEDIGDIVGYCRGCNNRFAHGLISIHAKTG